MRRTVENCKGTTLRQLYDTVGLEYDFFVLCFVSEHINFISAQKLPHVHLILTTKILSIVLTSRIF
jgi:hypothetical protein